MQLTIAYHPIMETNNVAIFVETVRKRSFAAVARNEELTRLPFPVRSHH